MVSCHTHHKINVKTTTIPSFAMLNILENLHKNQRKTGLQLLNFRDLTWLPEKKDTALGGGGGGGFPVSHSLCYQFPPPSLVVLGALFLLQNEGVHGKKP